MVSMFICHSLARWSWNFFESNDCKCVKFDVNKQCWVQAHTRGSLRCTVFSWNVLTYQQVRESNSLKRVSFSEPNVIITAAEAVNIDCRLFGSAADWLNLILFLAARQRMNFGAKSRRIKWTRCFTRSTSVMQAMQRLYGTRAIDWTDDASFPQTSNEISCGV